MAEDGRQAHRQKISSPEPAPARRVQGTLTGRGAADRERRAGQAAPSEGTRRASGAAGPSGDRIDTPCRGQGNPVNSGITAGGAVLGEPFGAGFALSPGTTERTARGRGPGFLCW